MGDTLMEILKHPATWAIAGILVKALCPAWVPILGLGRKLVKELTDLHDVSEKPNKAAIALAEEMGLKVVAKHLKKTLG